MPTDDFRTRLGRAGLDALMRDPRYWAGDDPQHGDVVRAVQRGFQLIFDDETQPGPSRGATPRPPGPFRRTLTRHPVDEAEFESSPTKLREGIGRRLMLAALEADGHPFPRGPGDPPLAARTPGAMAPDDTPRGAGGGGKRTAAARVQGRAGRGAVIATGPGGSADAIRAVAAGTGAAPARIRAAPRLPPRGRVARGLAQRQPRHRRQKGLGAA